jgi:hypothetical protein
MRAIDRPNRPTPRGVRLTTMKDIDKQQATRAAESAWAASPAIRAEFGDDKAAFVAYRLGVASGRVRLNTRQREAEIREAYAALEVATQAYAQNLKDPAALDAYVAAKRAYEAIQA